MLIWNVSPSEITFIVGNTNRLGRSYKREIIFVFFPPSSSKSEGGKWFQDECDNPNQQG